MRKANIILALFIMLSLVSAAQQVVRYELFVRDTILNFTGKDKHAISVNGQIPMPILTFTEGDTAEIIVHNLLKEPTSMHWHGVFLPNMEDGVPYLTQMPIQPGTTHVYRFPVIQNGTHWYHSHSGLQEQIGMYGMLIFNKRKEDPEVRKGIDDLPTIPLILSEWTDLKPEQVHRMLHSGTEWFAIQKGSAQTYGEAIKNGYFNAKVQNEWKRMVAMDVSDVYYDRVLVNGDTALAFPSFRAGDKVRLRIANGGASTYFWLSYSGGKLEVVASDGNDVQPVLVDRLLIAVSETYDVIITVPENKQFEFLITSEDRTNQASLYFGSGEAVDAFEWPTLLYFEGMEMMNSMMKMNGELDDMGMHMSLNTMDMNAVMYPEMSPGSFQRYAEPGHDHTQHTAITSGSPVTLNYAMLKAVSGTALPADAPIRELHFTLTGNMPRYVWSMDNKVISETDKILIRKGEVVRLVLYNGSMMRHPMHLHGHDFRVVNGQGDFAPLKNVIDIMPMETDTLEFLANAEGDWFFHCHILYHMMSGMGRIFTYEDQQPNPLIPDPKKATRKLYADDRSMHFMAENDFATNGNDGMLMLQNTRWSIGAEWRLGYMDMHGYETEIHLGRYMGTMQWFMPFVGFDWRYRTMEEGEQETNLFGQSNTKDRRAFFSAGFTYTLPMLVEFQAEIYQDGNLRIQVTRDDIPLTPHLRMQLMVNSDKEYMGRMWYVLTKNLSLSTHYDSDMGFGLGVRVNY